MKNITKSNAYTKGTDEFNPKFYQKSGWLTIYSLACGYIEFVEINGNRLTLSYEGACFHVKLNSQWDSFDTHPEAKKAFINHYKSITQ